MPDPLLVFLAAIVPALLSYLAGRAQHRRESGRIASESMVAANKDLREDREVYRGEIRELRAEVERLTQEADAKQATIERMEGEMEDLRIRAEGLEAEVARLTAIVEKLRLKEP